jgi:surfactin synthase thioesterase subunit
MSTACSNNIRPLIQLVVKADWSGCANSETKGVNDMLNHLSTMAKACPKQRYVLGGHSQGAVVTTTVAPKIPKDLLPRVLAMTMFGAPPCPSVVRDRCKSYCNKGDDVSLLIRLND